ncbi:beta-lactamase [Xylariales sp. PMI_506]|nr:beta-lactamase [Xylariales sp. PMI_506]
MTFSAQTTSELQSILGQNVAGEKPKIAGTTFVVVGKDGNELFAQSAGRRGVTSQEPMSLDSVFWIASCTKMLTGLACMQLVESSSLSLDDVEQVEGLCPELKELKVLRKDGNLEDKKNGITLRMLLTHTAGFGYTFFNDRLRDWSQPIGHDEFSGRIDDITKLPLLFQPGEGWEYGVGIDWAGIVLERKTGSSLNDYIQKNICQPLGLDNLNMFPTPSMKKNLAYMHYRRPDGVLVPRDHLHRHALVISTEEEIASCFNSGGAGVFAKPQEYARVLSVLLNDGTCPKTGVKLLEKSTVDEMFRNQVPQFPDLGRQGIPAAKPDLTNVIPDIYPVPGKPPQGWGLTFMITESPTGRPKTAGWWAGLPNMYWWCDRENGVAGIVCSQILPFADADVLGMWVNLESAVYRALGVK